MTNELISKEIRTIIINYICSRAHLEDPKEPIYKYREYLKRKSDGELREMLLTSSFF